MKNYTKQTPYTPSRRFYRPVKNNIINKKNNPEKKLLKSIHRKQGRNCYGRITSRRRGGGHKKLYRIIDFKRNKYNVPAIVKSIEYDPNRSANIALVSYMDGEKKYIIAPKDIKIGDKIISINHSYSDELTSGMTLPLKYIPSSTIIHNIELRPGQGAKIARGAGCKAQLIKNDNDKKMSIIKMPSGELRMVHINCHATIGTIGNILHNRKKLGKAGRNRWLGNRPRVRGVAMNPVDHPMGGGEGKSSGGRHPVSPWSQAAKGLLTRKKSNYSNKYILVRRNGKKLKKNN